MSQQEDELEPVPSEELLGDVAEVSGYNVAEVHEERLSWGASRRTFLLSPKALCGSRVTVAIHECVVDERDPARVFILSGSGATSAETLLWLSRRFRKNYVAVDWLGRGASPPHERLSGTRGPLFMEGADYRESYQHHNQQVLWAALNWMFSEGRRPDHLIGRGWGGVYCFSLACLDPRVRAIYSSRGCGGFSLQANLRQTSWDGLIDHIGPARARSWYRAFDPLLRIRDMKAKAYLEGATNEGVFSLPMLEETWKRIPRKNGFALAANQIRSMRPFDLQPYLLEDMDVRCADRNRADAVCSASLNWEVASPIIGCWPISPRDIDSYRLIVSEQMPRISEMSRDWRATKAAHTAGKSAYFEIEPTHPSTVLAYYLERKAIVGDVELRFTSHVARGSADERGLRTGAVHGSAKSLWSVTQDLDEIEHPIGDKINPRVVVGPKAAAAEISFSRVRWARTTIFGLKPWHYANDWIVLELIFTLPPSQGDVRDLQVFLSTNYGRWDERAVLQGLEQGEMSVSREQVSIRLRRSGFVAGDINPRRFGAGPEFNAGGVLDSFDAVGFLDADGLNGGALHLREVVLRT